MAKFRFLFLFFFLLAAFPVPSSYAESVQLKLGRLFAEGRTLEMGALLGTRLSKAGASPDLWLEWADLRKSQGDYPGAVEAYRRSLELKEDWKVRRGLALALEQMGDFAPAEEALTVLARDHGEDPDLLWGLARLRYFQYRWKSIRTQASPEEALRDSQKYLKKLAAVRPDLALAVWQLAEVSRLLGDRDQALANYQRVLKLDPSYRLAHRRIAGILAKKGRVREALAKYEQAMAIEPDDQALREEARRLERKAPAEVERRKVQRLAQWAKWEGPQEKPIAGSPMTLRIGLFTGAGHLLLKCRSPLEVREGEEAAPLTVLAPGDYQVQFRSASKSGGRPESWTLRNKGGRKVLSFEREIRLVPKEPGKPVLLHAVPFNKGYFMAREEDRAYRGQVELIPRGKDGFQVVNRVGLEDYLAGVLPSEMSPRWPMEAQKAQAIVARTYALSRLGHHRSQGFDLCDNVDCQVYRGLGAEEEKSSEAVRQTAGVVLKHGSRYISAVFSAQCGGHTQDYFEAWGVKGPVVGVADYDPRYNQDLEFPLSPARMESWIREPRVAYCRTYGLNGYQNYRWAALAPASLLEKKAPSLGRIRRLIVTHRSTAGWADRLLVEGEKGSKEWKGDHIRGFLGGIRSNLIWIEPQFNPKGWPEEFIIYGGGWGHGVGLCQVGCLGLARAGKTCGEILGHYFPKASVQKLADTGR